MGFQVFLEHGPLSIVEIRFRLNFTCSRLNIRTSCRSDGRKSAKTPSSAFKLDIWMAWLKNLCFGIWTTLHFEIWTGPYFKSGPFYTKCAQYGPLLQIILKHVFGSQFEELILITRICASSGLRMKFKTLCYPVFGRHKNTALPSFWFPIILIAFNASIVYPDN